MTAALRTVLWMVLFYGVCSLSACAKKASKPGPEPTVIQAQSVPGGQTTPDEDLDDDGSEIDDSEEVEDTDEDEYGCDTEAVLALEAEEAEEAIAEFSETQRQVMGATLAELKCAERRRSPAELEAFRAQLLNQYGWDPETFDSTARLLLEADAVTKKAYERRLEACVHSAADPKLQKKANKVYIDQMCLARRGLTRTRWAKRSAAIYGRHRITPKEYTLTMRSLIRDSEQQAELVERLARACPKRKTIRALAAGRYRGTAEGLDGLKFVLKFRIENKTMKDLSLPIAGEDWEAAGTLIDEAVFLSGRLGHGRLVFHGFRDGKKVTGIFHGMVDGRLQRGQWTAKRVR